MAQRVFQVAKELGVDSKLIVRKLIREELPPPPNDRDEDGRPKPWTHLSVVSVGLKEMIREWNAAGELAAASGDESAAEKSRKPRPKSRAATAAAAGLSDASDDALTRNALEAVAQINREAQQKKRAQLDTLRQSRSAILAQIKDVQHQIDQIDAALAAITGQRAAAPKSGRRDLSDLRERMGRWLESRRGEQFGAAALAHEFPELGDTAVSYILKPFVESGRLKADFSEGPKRPKYFAVSGV
jgi:hypothetical protein